MSERPPRPVPGWIARSAQPAPAGRAAVSRAPAMAAPMRAPAPAVGLGLDSAAVRARMAQRLEAAGIAHPSVLHAMATVERHRFVDSALVNQAYEDTSLPIGLGQTISKPSVVARMIELLLNSEAGKAGLGRVLEIGTGCGYQAAVLAVVAKEVYSIERLRGLHEKARNNLRPWRLANAHLILGDGMQGFASGAPYAGIICAAGGAAVPDAWCDQLAVGGRLVAPVVVSAGKQALLVIDKSSHGFKQSVLEAVNFVPLKSGIA
ncbi:protein-L-isoaspartate(D-aspartate) O-methyltransferase [Comamonas sp.]|uniref:protein-L-isoaspartate(D-aspartate) O-methyltransferase n=1 Tax=Comamonas sp. TaxID=34028 RepID=UPI003A92EE58